MAFEHHRVERCGVNLHCVSCGEGPAVLLIHGFPQHWWMWRDLMRRLSNAGYRAIAVDQRGMGGSDIPPGGYDKKTLAADVAAVLDNLVGSPAVVVGYDHGGGTALALAFERPELVSKLVVIEYAPPGFGYEFGLTAAPGNVNWQLAFFTQVDVAVSFIQGKERELLSWYFWHWAHNADAVVQEDFEVYVRQLQKPGGLRGGFAHFASVFEDLDHFKAWNARGQLLMPILGIGGETAAGTYIETGLSPLAASLQTAVIPSCGHWVAEEQPQALAEAILNLLNAPDTSVSR